MRNFEAQPPIGERGMTLKQMLEASEQAFEETGHYAGLKEFQLKRKQPILYEKMFSKIRGSLVNARETAMNISASPIVKEIGELCFALYTPEGDSISLSTGIIVHVHTMSDAIKYMIRHDFEENPGIADGDIYINNDPHVGNVHNADVQTLIPLFHEGEIIGWAGAVTHELDIGAVTPGSIPIGPINRLEDGIDCPVLKCGAKDTLFRDHVLRCEKATRTPHFWKLDEKARVAGNHLIRRAVEELVAEVGLDTYKQFIREIIEEGRESFLNRIKELTIPGRYRGTAFSSYDFTEEVQLVQKARIPKLAHLPLEMIIDEDGQVNISMEGADEWGYHSMNCTPSGMQGAIWVVMSQLVIPNDKVNDGAYFGTKSYFPPGSWANPQNTMASTGIAWMYLIPSFTNLFKHLSRGFQSRGYFEDVISAYGMTSNVFQGGGTDQYGNESATTNFEMSCCGAGAGYSKDGLDFAAAMWNPEGDMGEVEVWELIEPFLYLGRRIRPNSSGPGKQRGGSGFESLKMAWNTPEYDLQNIDTGYTFSNSGLWGGYPTAAGYRKNYKQSNLPELFKTKQDYPTHVGDPANSPIDQMVKAKEVEWDKRTVTLPTPFHQGDLFVSMTNGGSGVGDPLEREPADVLKDVEGDFLLERFTSSIYGVKLEKEGKTWKVDLDTTQELRHQMREDRGQKAMPVSRWKKETREQILKKSYSRPVTEMYRSVMKLSQKFSDEYRMFFDLPEDFTF